MILSFWQLRRSKRITSLQADLYYFLLQESNSRGEGLEWENPFECSNKLICAGIGISEDAIKDARNRLKQLGLIDFIPGERNKRPAVYELFYPFRTGNIPGNTAGKDPGKTPATRRVKTPTLLKEELNTTETKTSSSDADASAGDEKKEPSLYTACITIYDTFIRARTEMGPKIDGRQGTAMKNIIGYLTTQAKAKQPDRPPEEVEARVKEVWSGILENWNLLTPWQQGRLQLSDINSEMTNILTAIKNGTNGTPRHGSGTTTGTSGQPAKQAGGRGATVDELQGLKRGASAPGTQRADSSEAGDSDR